MMATDRSADIACSAITIDEASIAIAWQAICAELSIAAIMHELLCRVLLLLVAVFKKPHSNLADSIQRSLE